MSLEELHEYLNIMRNYIHEIHKLTCMDFKGEFGGIPILFQYHEELFS